MRYAVIFISLLVLSGCGDDKPKKPAPSQQGNPVIQIPDFQNEVPPPPVVKQEEKPPVIIQPRVDQDALRRAELAAQQQRERLASTNNRTVLASQQAKTPQTHNQNYQSLKIGQDVSTLPVNRDFIITADRYIYATLIDSINSEIPGRAIVQVDRAIYGGSGKQELLPAGTKLICSYGSLQNIGSTRLNIQCTRGIRPDGVSFLLSGALVADMSGRTGLIGSVDRRFFERYGDAFVVAVLSSLSSLGSFKSPDGSFQSTAAENLANNLGEVTASILEESKNVKPIITIPAGTKIVIAPITDIFIRQVEQP